MLPLLLPSSSSGMKSSSLNNLYVSDTATAVGGKAASEGRRTPARLNTSPHFNTANPGVVVDIGGRPPVSPEIQHTHSTATLNIPRGEIEVVE